MSLDDTYERMLCSIDGSLIKDVRRSLTLLCFAPRPLTVSELIDGIAMNIEPSLGFDPKNRLKDADGIQELCPGFVDVGFRPDHTIETHDVGEAVPFVRIAHFSVQEYLVTDCIRNQKAAAFALIGEVAHSEIAQICLGYLLEPGLSSSKLDRNILEVFPLATFAAKFWFHHYKSSGHLTARLDKYVMKLFENEAAYRMWVKLYDIELGLGLSENCKRAPDDIASPIYIASLLGLDKVLCKLCEKESAQHSGRFRSDPRIFQGFNSDDGQYGSALQAASYEGNKTVVQLLLKNGADVNAQGGAFGNALQAALYDGHVEVIGLLLRHGADVNAQGREGGNALQAALRYGHENLIQLLLVCGANVNAQGGEYGNALQAAIERGNEDAVRLLLEKGANVNDQGGRYGTALQAAASYNSNEEMVQLLLDKGAKVNVQSGEFGNALQAAMYDGNERVVQLLLDREADVNAQGGCFGNALEAASLYGHEKIVRLLLIHGAKVNAQGGSYGNALQAASCNGKEEVVKLLLNSQADFNAQGGEFGNALQAALFYGHEKVVQLLLDHGAVDIRTPDGRMHR